jgi:DNA topoisomerase I
MSSLTALPDPVESAKEAGLHYVSDLKPGIARRRCGKGFVYIGADGARIRDPEILGRIRSLAIPPAWTQVWICPSARGHLQATGRDAKKRKQSRYHPRWREVRDEAKYDHMVAFGAALPSIRRRVEEDLGLAGLPQQKVLAAIVRLMEVTLIRVGNEEYARENHSFGLTTMRVRHVEIEGSTATFRFQGKSGVRHTVDINDRRLVKIIERCQDIPGYELFQFLDADVNPCTIDSADVNTYLREISSQDFTAKDFRTWAGTVLACMSLREFDEFKSPTEAKRNVVQAIKAVAKQLGNTPSVCRKCYVHPAVLDCYMNRVLPPSLRKRARRTISGAFGLHGEELTLMRLLQKRTKTKR